jgi:hypothetical protein
MNTTPLLHATTAALAELTPDPRRLHLGQANLVAEKHRVECLLIIN